MSGRHSGRGRGRYQRGGRGGRSNKGQTYPTKKKKSIEDYTYYVGNFQQASDYEITTEYVINHIKKTYDYSGDIAKALKNLEPLDLDQEKPQVQISLKTDETARELEQKQFDIELKYEWDAYSKRLYTYKTNLVKSYALLWERCAKAMQNKIQSRSDFDTKIEDDPIELLKAIKEHALNFQESRYEMSIIDDSISALWTTKQKDMESLQDYTKRFKVAKDVMVSHLGGPIIMIKYVKSLPEYDEKDSVKNEQLIEQSFEKLLAYLYIRQADQNKYGSILTGLNTQQSLKNNQFPKTLADAMNVLSNHKFDKTHNSNRSGPRSRSNPKDGKDDTESPEKKDESPTLSFAQMEGKCYCCGKAGHKSPQCRFSDRPKPEWAINKAKTADSHAQTSENSDNKSESGSNAKSSSSDSDNKDSAVSSITGWAGAHVQFYQGPKMQNWILLDNQSSTSIFCNPKYVSNIRTTDETLNLRTNGGVLTTNQKGDVEHFGEVWFCDKAITNIFSLAQMRDKYPVRYDSTKEDSFVVELPHKSIEFKRSHNDLYFLKPEEPENSDVQFVNTLTENKTFYTPRQFDKAKKARELFQALGNPSIPDMLALIRMNMVKNNPVTTADVKLAEKIFGPDIGSIKGKTTRRKPLPVNDDYVDIPPELIRAQREVTLAIDGMTVNGLKFLTTISRNIYYRTAHYLPRMTMENYKTALDGVFRIYHLAGFRVTMILADNEFRPIMDELALQYNVATNYANAQEHVPEAERNNRVIKERVRTAYHRLPYVHLTREMLKYLVIDAPMKLNFFPARHGVSLHYSPRMIMHQQQVDFQKHCQVAFGSYVQAHHEPTPTNTNAPRALDCIYLRYNSSHQGGHECLHLQTNAIVLRRRVTPIPVTPGVIRQVHAIAERDQMPNGLKIQNRFNVTLYDSSWIAGVDYDEDDENENEDEDDDATYNDNDDEGGTEADDAEEYDELNPNEMAELLEDENEPILAPTVELQDEVETPQNEHEIVNEDINEPEPDPDPEPEPIPQIEQPNPAPEPDEPRNETVTRTGRVSRAPERINLLEVEDQAGEKIVEEYSLMTARVIAIIMCQWNDNDQVSDMVYQFLQTYSLNAGIKKYQQKGREAAFKEMKQLHDRLVFKPIRFEDMTDEEIKKALESLIFLSEKRDGTVKARTCANGSTQRDYISRDEAASPTVATEAIVITSTIESKQERDVMTTDIPNAFVQTDMKTKDGKRVTMKIRGQLVDMLVEMCPEVYADYVVYEGKHKVLYVEMLKALYGMLVSSLLYYKKFRKDIEEIGFEVNPYDPCVANRMVDGKQHTITWHVDDLKSSHIDPKVNDKFLEWLNEKYGKHGAVKATRGTKHDYLAMIMDYETPGVVKLDMRYYVEAMIKEFPAELSGNSKCPWNEKLFKIDEKAKKLGDEKKKILHTFTMKAMFLAKRARQDILPAVAFLSTRVKDPDTSDWQKLLKMMNYLKSTKEMVTTLEASDDQKIIWHVDAAFSVHPDMKSHTGATMTLGKGAVTSVSSKQKVNTRSSTEAELVAVDDILSKILWTKRFIEAQGFKVDVNCVFQDNTSTMKLETNGKASSGKRTRHFNIKLFYVTDLVKRGEIQIEYCPTENMVADYMTKPLAGAKFEEFRNEIMNLGLYSRSVLEVKSDEKSEWNYISKGRLKPK